MNALMKQSDGASCPGNAVRAPPERSQSRDEGGVKDAIEGR